MKLSLFLLISPVNVAAYVCRYQLLRGYGFPSPSSLAYVDDKHQEVSSTETDTAMPKSKTMKFEDWIVRRHYGEWCFKYSKAPSEERYIIYKHHLLVQENWNKINGKHYDLNEFGDCTEEEYLKVASKTAQCEKDAIIIEGPNVVKNELEITAANIRPTNITRHFATIIAPEARGFQVPAREKIHQDILYLDWSTEDATVTPMITEITPPTIFDLHNSCTTTGSTTGGRYLDYPCDVVVSIPPPKSSNRQSPIEGLQKLGEHCFRILMELCRQK